MAMRNIEVIFIPDGFLRTPNWVDAVVLGAGVAANHPVPATSPNDASFAIFSSTGNFYANYDTPATLPAGTVDDGTASELNPTMRMVHGTGYISLIAPVACVVTIAFFRT